MEEEEEEEEEWEEEEWEEEEWQSILETLYFSLFFLFTAEPKPTKTQPYYLLLNPTIKGTEETWFEQLFLTRTDADQSVAIEYAIASVPR